MNKENKEFINEESTESQRQVRCTIPTCAMKYEQKYKEALDKLKQGLASEDGREINGITRNFLEEVFPELKESEDDRIRRELIEFIRTLPCTIHVKEEYFHWLEKQGEKKSIDMSIKEKAHQIAWETSKHYDPLLSKESWCEMAALDMAYWLEKQGEQKPAWSEEDEDMFLMCSDAIAAACAAGYYTTEEMHTMQNWLKSMKPNHWKPSEEQMEALKKRTYGLHTSSETRKALESLIDDLKKL